MRRDIGDVAVNRGRSSAGRLDGDAVTERPRRPTLVGDDVEAALARAKAQAAADAPAAPVTRAAGRSLMPSRSPSSSSRAMIIRWIWLVPS